MNYLLSVLEAATEAYFEAATDQREPTKWERIVGNPEKDPPSPPQSAQADVEDQRVLSVDSLRETVDPPRHTTTRPEPPEPPNDGGLCTGTEQDCEDIYYFNLWNTLEMRENFSFEPDSPAMQSVIRVLGIIYPDRDDTADYGSDDGSDDGSDYGSDNDMPTNPFPKQGGLKGGNSKTFPGPSHRKSRSPAPTSFGANSKTFPGPSHRIFRSPAPKTFGTNLKTFPGPSHRIFRSPPAHRRTNKRRLD